MPSIEITRIDDPYDPAAFDAWWDAYSEARRADLESNTHMLAVNTRLGFRVTARMGELQKRLG